MSNPGELNFQGSKTSSQSRHMYIVNKINASLSYMGHNIQKCAFFVYSGGPVWPINNRTVMLPRHPLTYINLHITYGSNPIRIF